MAQGRAAGGSVSLARLIRDHGEAIDADLTRYYHLDLAELYRRPAPAGPHPLCWTVTGWRGPAVAGAAAVADGALAWLSAPVAALAAVMVAAVVWLSYVLPTRPAATPGPGITPRRVLGLLRHLPEDSATVAELRGGRHHRGWTHDRYLYTTIGELLQQLVWVTTAANSKKSPPEKPKPLPRPADIDRKRERQREQAEQPNPFLEALRAKRNRREAMRSGSD